MRLLTWALRDLLKSRKFVLVFLLNAALSLVGVLTIQTVDSSLAENIQAKALNLLGADLTLSARRSISEKELEQIRSLIPAERRENRIWELFSMAQSPELAKLVYVKAIDPGYPLYGEILLEERGAVSAEDLAEKDGLPGVWVGGEFLSQFAVEKGSIVTIGGVPFQVRGVIQSDSTQGLRFSAMAERVYVSRAVIESSPLFTRGTTFTETFSFAWTSERSADAAADEFFGINQDSTLRLSTVKEAQRNFARPLQYLADYLGLVAVAALTLGFIGLTYLIRGFLAERSATLAIWKILGLSSNRAAAVVLFQYFILGCGAWVLAVFASQMFLPLLQRALNAASSQELTLHLRPQVLAQSFLLVLVVMLAAAMPPVLMTAKSRIAAILRREELFVGWRKLWEVLPIAVVLTLVALGFSNSYRTGFGFMGSLLAVLLVFGFATWLFLQVSRLLLSGNWLWRQAQLYLIRNRNIVTIHIIALGLGAVLIGIFPHLRKGLEERFAKPDLSEVPSYFMFDIQDEQLPQVEALLSESQLPLLQKSPLVRARIVKVNGETYERPVIADEDLTREEEEEARFRNRGVNLSYRSDLAPGDQIVAGEPVSGPYSGEGPVELSVEDRYADRMDMKLGDVLVFDVQGVEFEGVIKNLRSVNWSRFQPNFFIIMQPGLLDEAPKTWLGAVPEIGPDLQKTFLRTMAQRFPNVSVIDVKDTASRTLETADQMLLSVNLMFVLIFLVGGLVLATVLMSQAERRVWDLNLLRILGAEEATLRRLLRAEFVQVVSLATALAVGFSLAIAWLVGGFFFEGMYAISWWGILGVVSAIFLISFLIAEFANSKILKTRPGILLRRE